MWKWLLLTPCELDLGNTNHAYPGRATTQGTQSRQLPAARPPPDHRLTRQGTPGDTGGLCLSKPCASRYTVSCGSLFGQSLQDSTYSLIMRPITLQPDQ